MKGLFISNISRAVLFFACIFFSAATVQAKHLVGGSITYKYLGKYNGLYEFEIRADLYRDCSQNGAPPLDTYISLGIYEHTGGSERLIDTVVLSQVSLQTVDPVSAGSTCSFNTKTCLQGGTYIGVARLPESSQGYDMQYLRCCRNNMTNLPDNSGYNYYGFISPTAYKNTSPSFNDVPIPYMCTNDTLTVDFSADEPDGDSITYTIAWPYSGATSGSPNPAPPAYFTTPSLVQYNSGYSYLTPFGAKGICTIDKLTGLLTVFAPKSGIYVIAVDYHEYRNGVLINTTRRDVQFIVLSCPSNPAPVRQAIGGSAATDYYSTPGSAFDINLSYSDPNDDNVTFSATGAVLTRKTNPAVITALSSPNNYTVNENIKWTPQCNDVSTKPYTVIVKAQDHGCPPKATIQSINLWVQAPPGPASISGPVSACGILDTFTYTATAPKNSTLLWSVANGTVISSKTASAVRVIFNKAATSAKIKVVAINAQGCSSDTVVLDVKIFPKPVASVLTGPVGACINNVSKYQLSGGTYTSFSWSYPGASLVSDNGTDITVKWDSMGLHTLSVIEKDNNGCFSDSLKLQVDIGKAIADSIFGSLSVCPNAKGIAYYTRYQKGSVYQWFITGGTQASGGSTNDITINWGGKGPGTIKVIETTKYGCVGDTVTYNVVIDYHLYTAAIGGDTELCENSKGIRYSVNNSHNSNYAWSVSGGSIVSGQGSYEILVNWGKAGNGFLQVQETAYDSVNNESCSGAPVSLSVKIDSVPVAGGIKGNIITCAGSQGMYLVSGFAGSTYRWGVSDTNIVLGAQGNDSMLVDFTKPGNYILSVQETSKHGCSGPVQRLSILVDSIPQTGPVNGPDKICAPFKSAYVYNVSGRYGSVYQWDVENGTVVLGDTTDAVAIKWNGPGTGKITVTETSLHGCTGKPVSMNVTIDSLALVMDLVTTSRANDNQIELHWHTVNNQFMTSPVDIYRSADPAAAGYRLVGSVLSSENEYIDTKVSTHSLAYYYKVSTQNSCNATISSNIHRSILLQNKALEDSIIPLIWNNYKGWSVGHYEILKTENADTALNDYSNVFDTAGVAYTDLKGYKLCYRVAAMERGTATVSYSNSVCIDLNPVIWIPNVFTPNNDNTNNTWRVVVSHYMNYRADIYNRWGERVWSTNDPANEWDGTFKGAKCPEGVYLYMIEVGGIRENLYRNGTLNLLR